jgi:two-component system cell cycle sensor histidine kinase/response regulator CckA
VTIFVVDDDPGICRLVATTLEQEGFSVLTANNGLEAMALWRSKHRQVDLLITDMTMPHMDGPVLARRLATDDPGIRVLFISGERDTTELREFQYSGFLGKPFNRSTLIAEVSRLLQLHATTAAS